MSVPTADEIREVIRDKVRDPELMMNIVDLGLIYNIEVSSENTAEITMTLTSPGCPAGPEIIEYNLSLCWIENTFVAFSDIDRIIVNV